MAADYCVICTFNDSYLLKSLLDELYLYFQVILDCAVGGSPMPEILWTKDGKPVTISNRIQQLTNGSLVIKNSIVSPPPNK